MTVRVAVAELGGSPPGTRVQVAGRIVAHAERGALLRDVSGTALLLATQAPPLHALVCARGVWDGYSITVDALELLQSAGREPRELAELAGHDNRKQRRLIARARIVRELRAFFDQSGFLEVETPIVVPSPGLDLHLDAPAVSTPAGTLYLSTSPEYQMKRLLAGGLERIYQLSKCFRNDEAGERHQPEFTMLEWYRAYADVEAMMRDTEQLVAAVAMALSGRPVLETAAGPIDVAPPWRRITVRDAFVRFAGRPLADVLPDEEVFYRLLIERVEPALAELGALFLCEYPASMASLARKKPSDPSVAERFEAYVAGVELCNGFGELTDPLEQRARLEVDQAERARRGLPIYPLDERFLAALEEGVPPSGGNALGLDRLVMLALGASHIEQVIAIPRSRL